MHLRGPLQAKHTYRQRSSTHRFVGVPMSSLTTLLFFRNRNTERLFKKQDERKAIGGDMISASIRKRLRKTYCGSLHHRRASLVPRRLLADSLETPFDLRDFQTWRRLQAGELQRSPSHHDFVKDNREDGRRPSGSIFAACSIWR